MNIPSPERCLELMEKMQMMSHIIDHSLMVQRVANTLARCLKDDTPGLNRDLILAGALLHDITKTRSFSTGEKHAQTGGALLARLGYFEVGEIVRQHVTLDPDVVRRTATEAAIVNYADKRVLHDQVVPLEQRLGYIMERYGTSQNAVVRIKRMWEETLSLERMLFKNLDITPDRLADHLV